MVNAKKAVTETESVQQALYREVQLALRALVGSRDLDVFLNDKDAVSEELNPAVGAAGWGFGFGIGFAGGSGM